MTPGIRPLVAGNWKMHGTGASLPEIDAVSRGAAGEIAARVDTLLCLPATLIWRAAEILRQGPVQAGGEDCHPAPSGPHTGDISAEMLRDAGASYVIVGHSERRVDHGESDGLVRAKAEAALRAGLTAIICIGETGDQRAAGRTLDVLTRQIAGSVPAAAAAGDTVIAYEPVWAIGTGLTPTVDDVAAAHAHIRRCLGRALGAEAKRIRLLYGGSCKPANAGELLAVDHVDGALVGGASLKAADFLAIAGAYLGFG